MNGFNRQCDQNEVLNMLPTVLLQLKNHADDRGPLKIFLVVRAVMRETKRHIGVVAEVNITEKILQ